VSRVIKAKEFLSEFGIAISDAENRLSELKPNDGEYFNEDGSKTHYLIPLYFSAISLILNNVTDILEIGTGCGNITNLLAKLFPSAMVYTIDIPRSDKDYKRLAWRYFKGEGMKKFKTNINENNIKFIKKNSFFLPSMGFSQEFDFIYVDGGHLYPAVAWDIMFAYNYLRPGGFAFFHDYGDDVDVKKVIEYIRNIIDEEINLVCSSVDCEEKNAAWLRKSTGEKVARDQQRGIEA